MESGMRQTTPPIGAGPVWTTPGVVVCEVFWAFAASYRMLGSGMGFRAHAANPLPWLPLWALSRNDAVKIGEHTRPRVCRPAPSPVAPMGASLTKGWPIQRLPCRRRGRRRLHARARALPISTAGSGLRNARNLAGKTGKRAHCGVSPGCTGDTTMQSDTTCLARPLAAQSLRAPAAAEVRRVSGCRRS